MSKDDEGYWALGLMSGTSLDGIDTALIRTDGEHILSFGPSMTVPFEPELMTRLRDAVHGKGDMLVMEQEITLKHAEAVKTLLKEAGMKSREIRVIGFHGQTVSHRPAEKMTWQIGNGALLAEKTGIDVVCDFRRRDMAAGGEGAPLVPLYHAALARHMELPVVMLNIGGIANITWIGRSEHTSSEVTSLDIIAFDTGPGNVLLNEWVYAHTGKDYDKDGKLALAGTPNMELVADMLRDPFFDRHPPKSLDRNAFNFDALKGMSKEDGAATLTEFTAASVERGAAFFPVPATQWFVSGGGRNNPALMAALKRHFVQVFPVESLGWVGDAIEAQAFAFLAVRSLKKLALSLPTTTGTLRAVTGGALYRA